MNGAKEKGAGRGSGGGIFCLMGSPHDPTLLPAATATQTCNTHMTDTGAGAGADAGGGSALWRVGSMCGPSWATIGTRAFFAAAHEIHPTKLAFVLACDAPLRSSVRAKTVLRRRRRCRPAAHTPSASHKAGRRPSIPAGTAGHEAEALGEVGGIGAVSPVRAEPWAKVEGAEFRKEVELAKEKKAVAAAAAAAAAAMERGDKGAARSKDSKGGAHKDTGKGAESARLRGSHDMDGSGDDAFAYHSYHHSHSSNDDDGSDHDGEHGHHHASQGGLTPSKGRQPLRITPLSDINSEFEVFDAERRARAREARSRLLSELSAIACDEQEAEAAAADAAAAAADAQSHCAVSSVVTVAAAARGVSLAGLLPRGLVDVPTLTRARAAAAAAGVEGQGLRHRHTLDGHASHSTAPADAAEIAEAAEWLDGLARVTALQALPSTTVDETE